MKGMEEKKNKKDGTADPAAEMCSELLPNAPIRLESREAKRR